MHYTRQKRCHHLLHTAESHMSTSEAHQYTLRQPVRCTGTGLHSGKTVQLVIHPAAADSGISFVRSDLPQKPVIPARFDRIGDTTLATTLGEGKSRIATVEHLMAALRGLGIDNARIDVDSPEIPIMDGSAWPFVETLRKVGRRRQSALRTYLRVTKPVACVAEDRSMRIEPSDDFRISCRIQFDADLIRQQRFSATINRKSFIRDIAKARTFGYVEQVEALWDQGLALGGSLENVIAIHWNRRTILNEDGLRYQDEFIRHKMLDIIGDAALAGAPILGHIIADRSGHSLHRDFLQTLFAQPECWEYVTLGTQH